MSSSPPGIDPRYLKAAGLVLAGLAAAALALGGVVLEINPDAPPAEPAPAPVSTRPGTAEADFLAAVERIAPQYVADPAARALFLERTRATCADLASGQPGEVDRAVERYAVGPERLTTAGATEVLAAARRTVCA